MRAATTAVTLYCFQQNTLMWAKVSVLKNFILKKKKTPPEKKTQLIIFPPKFFSLPIP